MDIKGKRKNSSCEISGTIFPIQPVPYIWLKIVYIWFFSYSAKVIGVGERTGAIYDPQGLDVEALYNYYRENSSFKGYSDRAELMDESVQILERECDILIPAALERQIGLRNADKIKAKIVGEAANGPVTPGAHEAMEKRGIVVIPDLLLNAGGVTVSYFEWLKNLSHVRFGRMNKKWDESVRSKLLNVVEENAGRTLTEAERKQIVHGAEEADLIYSGLEDTMISSCEGMYIFNRKEISDYVCICEWIT